MNSVIEMVFQGGLITRRMSNNYDFPFSNDNVYVLLLYVIVENGKSIQTVSNTQLYQFNLSWGIDTLSEVYQLNLKDFFDTESNTNSSYNVEFFQI